MSKIITRDDLRIILGGGTVITGDMKECLSVSQINNISKNSVNYLNSYKSNQIPQKVDVVLKEILINCSFYNFQDFHINPGFIVTQKFCRTKELTVATIEPNGGYETNSVSICVEMDSWVEVYHRMETANVYIINNTGIDVDTKYPGPDYLSWKFLSSASYYSLEVEYNP